MGSCWQQLLAYQLLFLLPTPLQHPSTSPVVTSQDGLESFVRTRPAESEFRVALLEEHSCTNQTGTGFLVMSRLLLTSMWGNFYNLSVLTLPSLAQEDVHLEKTLHNKVLRVGVSISNTQWGQNFKFGPSCWPTLKLLQKIFLKIYR